MEPTNNINSQTPQPGGSAGAPRVPRPARPVQPARPAGAPRPVQGQGGPRPAGSGQRPAQPVRPAGGAPRPAGNGGNGPARPGGQAGAGGQANGGGQGNGGGGPRPAGSGGGRASRERRRIQQQGPNHADLVPALDAMPVNKSIYNGLAGTQQSKRSAKPADAAAANAPAEGGERRANYATREPKLRVIPLGGLGEIGKSMMAIEYGNDIIVIDMGFKFPTAEQPGVDYMIPDTSWLLKNQHKVRAHIFTHGHEDHIGGIPFILPKFPAPMYGSRFTLARIEHKLQEYKLQTQPQYRVLDPDKHERVQIGAFSVELVRVTHSIPDATAVVVRTPAGTIVNTGDWRFDNMPIDNKPSDKERLKQLGDEGVLLLMSDSTNCEKAGHTTSEMEIAPTLDDLFGRAQGRIIISSFSTQIHRMQLVVNAAAKAGRKLAFVGRSMLGNVEIAVKTGNLKVPAGLVTRVQDIVNLPDNQIIVLCTGSQGEENSALSRMGRGDHQNIKIKPGDSIIFSSNPIPGNEVAVVHSVDNLMREGARIYQQYTGPIDNHGLIHVSGHAPREDLIEMMQLVRPKFFMPIHGEFHHLVRHAEIAVTGAGMPAGNVFVMDNGDVLEVTPSKAAKGPRVPAGIVMIDGAGIGDVEGVVLRDRLAMGDDGVFMVVATVSRKTGKLVTSPDIISRGFIYMKENEELINRARTEVRRLFETRAAAGTPTSREDWAKFKLRLRDEIGDLLYGKTKRNPMVLPVINEV
jgi:ribonuclease J